MKSSLQKLSLTLLAVVALTYTGQAQCTGNVNIPDANLKTALLADTLVNINKDTEIQCTEAEAFTGALNLFDRQIDDATGLERFINVTELNISWNKLRNIDVSANVALTTLYCYSNQLESLNVSANTTLISLYCGGNSLTIIDVSANTALEVLDCENNSLTSLDFSANTQLTYLSCQYNSLTSIDVSNNKTLTELHCASNSLKSLDVSNNAAMIHLFCQFNSLKSLNVSGNTALELLDCRFNSLTSLDLSTNSSLIHLICENNSLTNLDVSNNRTLYTIFGNYNQLTSLNLANNNNFILWNVSMNNNPNLYCVEVDDENDATTHNRWVASPQVLYKNSCGVGVAENQYSSTVTLYPNPTAGRFTVAVPASQLGTKLVLYNAIGKLVLQTTLLQSSTDINIENLSKGMYLVKTTNVQGNSTMQKLMAE
jgi:Leucine-rich repeat (LRR) protein